MSSRLLLNATLFALVLCAPPAYCQGNTATPEQLQLNQTLSAPQQPLQIIQQHQGVPTSSLGKLIDDMKGMVKDMVKVDVPNSGDPRVHVKAPFVNVDLEHGQPDVRVNAPFVHVTKSGGSPVSVQAPFANIGTPGNSQSPGASAGSGSVNIKAPFVNVDNSNNGPNVNVHAPFTNVETSPDGGTRVQAPFTNIGGDASSTPTPTPPAGTNTP